MVKSVKKELLPEQPEAPGEPARLKGVIELRKLAARALEVEKAKQAIQRKHDEDYHNYLIRESLARLLGYSKCQDDVGMRHGLHLEVDGLHFAHPEKCSDHGSYDLRLVYVCEKCNAELLSVRIVDLAHLGRMLEAPELDQKSARVKCDNAERHKPRHPSSVANEARRKAGRILQLE